jgi:hypothetical protein|tara:strand:+ start:2512 stop:2679 length:168 start_codon:yes stop_codon:yes gene_type:complete
MGVTVESYTIYLGAGLKRLGWVVYDDGVSAGFHADYVAARLDADTRIEQKEHRDG